MVILNMLFHHSKDFGGKIEIMGELTIVKRNNLNLFLLFILPEFVTKNNFDWAIEEAMNKKKQDFSKVQFFTYDEGLCIQMMHIGSYDSELSTIECMYKYMEENGYELDITNTRYHHEIYLGDPRRCDSSKLKTVIRHPNKKVRKEKMK